MFLKRVGKKTALWILPEGLACAVGAKANVPFAGWHKIAFKKCGGKKIKNIGSVSVSVYMLSVCNIVSMSVFTCQNGLLFLFIVVSLLLTGRPLHLLPTEGTKRHTR